MKRILGKGYKPSPPDAVGLGHPHHLLGATPLPSSAEAPTPPVIDQGQTSSCTGNSTAVAIQAAQSKALGLPAGQWSELPSRLQLYYDARAIENNTGADDGAAISDIFDAARVVGVCPESQWPFCTLDADGTPTNPQVITTQPDAEAYRAAADQKIVSGAYRITSEGVQRVQDIKAAIAAGHLVVWGTRLDQAFEELQPGDVWPGVTGADIGGHAMFLHAYAPYASGTKFASRSSWGPDFADNGSAWVSDAAIIDANAQEFWVVAVVDPFAKEVA